MSLEQISMPVASELQTVEKIIATETTSEIPLVTSVVQYIIGNGGKRLRPLLTFLSTKVAGTTGTDAAKLAAAMEMIHTATLLHDDVVDDAPLRRGKPSSKAKWGNQISVLVGDFFWTKASELIVSHGDLRALQVITRTITLTTEAEILEITKHNDFSINEETYIQIIRGKTALLLSTCAQLGAILGKVPESFEEALKRYGMDLGIAFQLTDDFLDYSAEEKVFGKKKGGDLTEGKLTLPLIVALKHSTGSETQVIKESLLSDRIEPNQLAIVIDIINKYNGLDYTSELAQIFANKAKEHLSVFKPSLEKDSLLHLADYAVERSV